MRQSSERASPVQSEDTNVNFQSYHVADVVRPDAEVDIGTDLEDAMNGVSRAITDLEESDESIAATPRAVLLHCDLGVNRSPTVALAVFLQRGYSLRETYSMVLGTRKQIDPIAPYRRALRDYEVKLRGKSSVGHDEYFAMHISEVLEEAERAESQHEEKECDSDSDSDSDGESDTRPTHFDMALKLRCASIEALLRESEQLSEV